MKAAAPARPPGRRLGRLGEIPVTTLEGVGPRKAAALAKLGIVTVLDLLLNYPRQYSDRTRTVQLAEAPVGEQVRASGEVVAVEQRRIKGGRAMVTVTLDDGSGRLRCTFFNQPWRAQQLRRGTEVDVFGKLELFRSQLQMTNPELDVVSAATVATGRERRRGLIVPIYSESEKAGVTSADLRSFVGEALRRAGELADPVPPEVLSRRRLVGRTDAFNAIHLPPSMEDKARARRRLAFDELFRLQLELVLRKREAEREARGITHVAASRWNGLAERRGGPGKHRAASPAGGKGGGPRAPSAEAPAAHDLVASFLALLPFQPTEAQRRAISEIAADLAASHPMHRLLQGDVGSGKTVVALATLLFAVEGGYQGALMVPTEVLAEQHYLAARRLLSGLAVADPGRLGGARPVEVALLTSRTGASDRARLWRDLDAGQVDILVGTHALITDDVVFSKLGVVVIDEQHRFGVDQRSALREKGGGNDPDVLVMTATPIPRTAAMTVYGDLDASVLDELPAGRRPVSTVWLDSEEGEETAWCAVREAAAAGQRVYVVCPLVRPTGEDDGAAGEDEGEDEDDQAEPGWDAESDAGAERTARADPPPGRLLDPGVTAVAAGDRTAGALPIARRPPRSAVEEHERLASGPLAGLRLGLLHGQLPAREKESVMSAFRAGELDVLVATTVIEVGVDVPEATVMVIEDADRFGIAQLHQLRGRVGRGGEESSCYLLAPALGDEAGRRLAALVASNDGFELAEVDLELRGEGTVLGTRQKGRNDLRLASLRTDFELVLLAREEAERIVRADPALDGAPLLKEELSLFIGEDEAAYLSKS